MVSCKKKHIFLYSIDVFCVFRSPVLDNIVTTVLLSVCYGALNLLARVDASNFIPYVCDRAIAGDYEGPESTVPSSAISGGSMAAERLYRIWRTLAPVVPVWVRLTLGPNTCFISFHSIIVPISSFLCPLYHPKFHLSSPKRRSQRGVVVSRA